jgi:hypothetical protein
MTKHALIMSEIMNLNNASGKLCKWEIITMLKREWDYGT